MSFSQEKYQVIIKIQNQKLYTKGRESIRRKESKVLLEKIKQQKMGRNWCLNGTMVDSANYSAPVPFVGVYTAGATLVCLLLITCDLWAGFRSRKSWLPCRYFSLNSVTLTLVSIASKLPVDLTTPMPSAQDQLSKITGTVFICISMAFLMPSLGINGEFESYANLLALSIFVVTVVVNICIQMATGVIFSFVIEHTIILFIMLVLLATLWVFAYVINGHKGVSIDRNRELITKGSEGCVLRRLKLCFLHGYCSCPQLELHRFPHFGTMSLVSTLSSVVLAEAVLRSLAFKDLKFCKGSSDYGWSMWILVGTQIFTVAVCTFAIGCRWLALADDMNWVKTKRKHRRGRHPHISYLRTAYPFYTRNLPKWLVLSLRYFYYFTVLPVNKLIALLVDIISRSLGWLMQVTKYKNDDKSIEEYKMLLHIHKVKVREWILRKGVEDMEKWMELNRSKSPDHMRDLLSKTNPSRVMLSRELQKQFYSNEGHGVSSLSILILVEMVKVSLPNSPLLVLMEDILGEVFETIHFIDKNINVGSFSDRIKSMSAEVIWKEKTSYGVINMTKVEQLADGQSPSELEHALVLIGEFHRSFTVDVVRDEVRAIVNLIHLRSYTSLEELHYQIRQLFVELLLVLLSQLPQAIFNHVVESPMEEYEERVKLGLKFICQMESLDSYVGWSLPIGCNLTSLINAQDATMENLNSSPTEEVVAPRIEDDEIQFFLEDANV